MSQALLLCVFVTQLDPRIWNSQDAIHANVPAAGGRFSATGLARFYHDLASGKLVDPKLLDQAMKLSPNKRKASIEGVQRMVGVSRLTNDANAGDRTALSMGYQLIRTDRDPADSFSGVGHAGVGGSVAFCHRPSGRSIAVMLNKADNDSHEMVTMRILRVIGDHYQI